MELGVCGEWRWWVVYRCPAEVDGRMFWNVECFWLCIPCLLIPCLPFQCESTINSLFPANAANGERSCPSGFLQNGTQCVGEFTGMFDTQRHSFSTSLCVRSQAGLTLDWIPNSAPYPTFDGHWILNQTSDGPGPSNPEFGGASLTKSQMRRKAPCVSRACLVPSLIVTLLTC